MAEIGAPRAARLDLPALISKSTLVFVEGWGFDSGERHVSVLINRLCDRSIPLASCRLCAFTCGLAVRHLTLPSSWQQSVIIKRPPKLEICLRLYANKCLCVNICLCFCLVKQCLFPLFLISRSASWSDRYLISLDTSGLQSSQTLSTSSQ